MSNGLDRLDERRKTRGRQAPAPKHPRSEQSEPTGKEQEPTTATPPSEPSAAPAKGRSDAVRSRRTPSIEAYLDEDLLDWLWEVEGAGVARRARNLASPVVRLALRELRARMSTEQIVDRLVEEAPPPRGRRPRPTR